jgi:hypothetical protein
MRLLFSDLVGSTALSERIDPEDLREVISAYQTCVAETVSRFDGFVSKYMIRKRAGPDRYPSMRPTRQCRSHRPKVDTLDPELYFGNWEQGDYVVKGGWASGYDLARACAAKLIEAKAASQ